MTRARRRRKRARGREPAAPTAAEMKRKGGAETRPERRIRRRGRRAARVRAQAATRVRTQVRVRLTRAASAILRRSQRSPRKTQSRSPALARWTRRRRVPRHLLASLHHRARKMCRRLPRRDHHRPRSGHPVQKRDQSLATAAAARSQATEEEGRGPSLLRGRGAGVEAGREAQRLSRRRSTLGG